ncbi:hypothetical protein ACWCRF_38380 [Streptomyces sp. NPDC002405]|uniref:hypothetical protein n=1 Tax=unclassified Streptomyces TaxID=2593676 RepID=UPI00369F15BE
MATTDPTSAPGTTVSGVLTMSSSGGAAGVDLVENEELVRTTVRDAGKSEQVRAAVGEHALAGDAAPDAPLG